MRGTTRTSLRGVALLAAAALLAGCSQVAALAPVGGDRPTEIRYATIDVLLDHDVEVLEAPTCQMAEDRAVTCTGTTVDGEEISAVSTAVDQSDFEVTVGDEVLFSGSIDEIIEKSMRP